MENAARALTMAAGVLIGIMIISIAVYLFTSLGNTSSEIYSKVEQTKIDKFNSQFLKYYRLDTCTAHDIVSIANLAKNSNEYYELEEGSGYNYYVNVSVMDYIDNNGSKKTERNFEKLDEAKYTEFIQNNSTVEENGKIKEIKYFMDLCKKGKDTYAERKEIFEKHKEKVIQEIKNLNETLDMINFKCWYYEKAILDGNEDNIKKMKVTGFPEEIELLYNKTHRDLRT